MAASNPIFSNFNLFGYSLHDAIYHFAETGIDELLWARTADLRSESRSAFNTKWIPLNKEDK
jgi:hypothetical protein